STTTESATGTGTAASSHSVSLSWNASSSPNIAGYNVYRAPYTTACGIYSKINGSLNTETAYVDSSLADHMNYCYATTAVNSSNEESGYSNIVADVQIP
ncbi:MAG: fibronectin type III domain-containing protein, partial [Candidatus Sulfotelmatobacter sp.]